MLVRAPRRRIIFQPHSGVLPGSALGPETFNHGLRRAVLEPWCTSCQQIDSSFSLKSILDPDKSMDASAGVFVDDIGKLIAGLTAYDLRMKGMAVNHELFSLAKQAGMQHNESKQELVVTALCGRGSHKVLKSFRTEQKLHDTTVLGRSKKAARYLGPVLSQMFSYYDERVRRIAAAKRAWIALRRFWQRCDDKAIVLMVFASSVYSVTVSAAVAFVPAAADIAAMQGFLLRCLRRLMKGGASMMHVDEQGNMAKRQRPNSVVWLWAKWAPLKDEMAMARLRFWQSILAQPKQHELLLSTFFGQFDIE